MTAAPGPARRSDAWWVVRMWLLSRGLLLLVALLVMVRHGRSGHDLLRAWDVAHFEAIATHGYADPIDRAFFPGLPLLLRGIQALGIPMGLGGAVLAVVCSALAAWALLRMGGPVAAGLWLFAPTTVFTTVAYTEAPFCAAAFWAWECARQRAWGRSALLAGLACTFRVSGLFLVGALGLYALTQHGATVRRRLLDATMIAAASLVLFGHAAYLHHLTGSWTAWFEAQQSGWNRGFTSPVESLRHTLDAARPSRWPDRPQVATVFAAEVVSMLVGLVLTLVLLVRRRWAQAGWVGVQVCAFATSYWFMSVNRALLLWFPLWLLAGELARHGWGKDADRGPGRALARVAVVTFGALSLAVMLWWAVQFYTGGWAS